MHVNFDGRGSYVGNAEGDEAVEAQAAVLQAHIHSQTVLKLGLYALAGFFVIVAAVLVVFAPAGREGVTTIIAFSLFAVALGSAGFSAFAIKAPFVAAQASSHPPQPGDLPPAPKGRRPVPR